MTSQQAQLIRGIGERLLPEAKKLVDLLGEVVWVLESDELDGAAAEGQGGGESRGVFFRELLGQPGEQVSPRGFCRAQGQR